MNEEVAPADIPKQWQEARANRQMQFKVGNYRDGFEESWQAPSKLTGYSCQLNNTLLHYQRWNKVSSLGYSGRKMLPLGITNAEKLQLSVFLPNELSLEDWYTEVYSLPTVWLEVSMMGVDHLRKVSQELAVLSSNKIIFASEVFAYRCVSTLHELILFSISHQRRRRIILFWVTCTFTSVRVTGITLQHGLFGRSIFFMWC